MTSLYNPLIPAPDYWTCHLAFVTDSEGRELELVRDQDGDVWVHDPEDDLDER